MDHEQIGSHLGKFPWSTAQCLTVLRCQSWLGIMTLHPERFWNGISGKFWAGVPERLWAGVLRWFLAGVPGKLSGCSWGTEQVLKGDWTGLSGRLWVGFPGRLNMYSRETMNRCSRETEQVFQGDWAGDPGRLWTALPGRLSRFFRETEQKFLGYFEQCSRKTLRRWSMETFRMCST